MKQEQENHILPKEIIEKLFSNALPTPEELEKKYPARDLPEGAMVTRFGPSPTGLVHIGGLYAEILAKWFARQSKGVSFLRIEDTDMEREVPGAKELIIKALDTFKISPDEGPTASGEDKGKYGPYTQTGRTEVYQAFAKKLIEEGKAYPCFMTSAELDSMREEQARLGIRPGYRRGNPTDRCEVATGSDGDIKIKDWVKWRDASPEKIEEEMKMGTPHVVRLRSNGDYEKRIAFDDAIKGTIELPENDIDDIILKSNGLPPYGFAHAIDDHLMRTTHVTRGVDWLPQTAFHLELFSALGWEPPKYGHFGNILKEDGVNEKGEPKLRKISKRLDPEANVMKFVEWGYPPEAVMQYLLNMMNSDFEDSNWRENHPSAPLSEFELSFEKLAPHAKGSLFDFKKLDNISRMEVIAKMSSMEVYEKSLEWAKQFNPELAKQMEDAEYTKAFFAMVFDNTNERVPKNLVRWDEIPEQVSFIYDELFHFETEKSNELLSGFVDTKENERPDVRGLAPTIVSEFLKTYDENDDRDTWWEKLKNIAFTLGFAKSDKVYQKEQEKYKGDLSDATRVFRVLLTGKRDSPDLYSIMKVMGKERVERRLKEIETVGL